MSKGREITANIKGLEDTLKGLTHSLKTYWRSSCESVVKRNGDIAEILHNPDEYRQHLLEQLLVQSAGFDGASKWSMDELLEAVCKARQQLDEVIGDIGDVLQVSQSNVADRDRALEIERQRFAALATRRKEHAIGCPEVRDQVWSITDGRCIYCDVEMTRERDPENPTVCFEVDHIVAKSNGGPDHLSNYVPACHGCNTSKSAKSIFRFLANRHGLPGLKVVGGTDA